MTPDSFSDGGRFVTETGVDVAGAVAAGKRLWADGADIVDVGGESTRPGAQPEEVREALTFLIKLYDAWGKPEEAAKYRAALSEQESVEPPESKTRVSP